MWAASGVCRKDTLLRPSNATGNWRMAVMRDLPDVQDRMRSNALRRFAPPKIMAIGSIANRKLDEVFSIGLVRSVAIIRRLFPRTGRRGRFALTLGASVDAVIE